jgi:hypothetical protein
MDSLFKHAKQTHLASQVELYSSKKMAQQLGWDYQNTG